ncbi:hypothetical protein [Vibrio ouci]|uniref:Uncharacterized protein n=1 Tax=Vibrio ouci TaxID=2499078 RepID=A0A4Y8WC18_9VIBR|nr:hypothetical protein [Vibrio ouci]TFH90173.1 hypothetical protein ELS82_18125 [Vibrio ouci]
MKTPCLQTILGITLLFPPAALCVPPYHPDLTSIGNRWKVSMYSLEDGKNHGWKDHIVCFKKTRVEGSHQNYEWHSSGADVLVGYAAQEGDQVFMYAFANMGARPKFSRISWELSNKNLGAGHWVEWRFPHDTQLDHFSKALFKRDGNCADNTTSSKAEQSPDIGSEL